MKKIINLTHNPLFEINTFFFKKQFLLKTKLNGIINTAGRNNNGKITIRHKGGGHKKSYRKIEFCRKNIFIAIIISIEYDPNRNANIAGTYNFYSQNFFYILAPKNLKIGDIIKSSYAANAKLGHALPLFKIPVGSYIYNVATNNSKFGKFSRAAGTFSKIKEKNLNYATIELSSKKIKKISVQCYATIGIVSNEISFLLRLRKAGQTRWLNKRPTVRGVAMNPIDHPNGGGEGKKSGQKITPWGKSNFKKTNKRHV